MRFGTLWLFLPHLVAAGFFSNHVQRNLNHEIDPCDDFYDHVCSTTSENSSVYQEKAPKWFLDAIRPLVSPKIREFLIQVDGDFKKFSDNELSNETLLALKNFFAQSRLPYIPNDPNFNDFQFLMALETYDANYRFELTPHYQKLVKNLDDVFTVLKGILNEEFLAAPWTKRHPKLLEFLKTVEIVHDKRSDLVLEKLIIKVQQIYEACLRLSINKTKSLCFTCLNLAITPAKLIKIKVNGEDKTMFHVMRYYINYISQFNARYVHNLNKVVLRPAIYTLEEDEQTFMIGSLQFVLSHELGHIFFHGPAVPSNSECFRKHIQNTCYSYISNKTECELYNTNGNGKPAEHGNYSRFDDDAADWIGVHAGLKALRKYYPKVFTETEQTDAGKRADQMKKFFYAYAINWCSKKPTQGDCEHSPNKVRVNGIASLFSEFTEVFQCKAGNKMAKVATCPPFAGIGAPNRKRNGLQ